MQLINIYKFDDFGFQNRKILAREYSNYDFMVCVDFIKNLFIFSSPYKPLNYVN